MGKNKKSSILGKATRGRILDTMLDLSRIQLYLSEAVSSKVIWMKCKLAMLSLDVYIIGGLSTPLSQWTMFTTVTNSSTWSVTATPEPIS